MCVCVCFFLFFFFLDYFTFPALHPLPGKTARYDRNIVDWAVKPLINQSTTYDHNYSAKSLMDLTREHTGRKYCAFLLVMAYFCELNIFFPKILLKMGFSPKLEILSVRCGAPCTLKQEIHLLSCQLDKRLFGFLSSLRQNFRYKCGNNLAQMELS